MLPHVANRRSVEVSFDENRSQLARDRLGGRRWPAGPITIVPDREYRSGHPPSPRRLRTARSVRSTSMHDVGRIAQYGRPQESKRLPFTPFATDVPAGGATQRSLVSPPTRRPQRERTPLTQR
jgi:hypothetical protein